MANKESEPAVSETAKEKDAAPDNALKDFSDR